MKLLAKITEKWTHKIRIKYLLFQLIEFGLVKASNSKQTKLLNIVPVNAQRIIYGKSETKRAIANVLMKVVFEYKFTSLSALNAVLKLYNVTADRGEKESKIYRNKGLNYRILDERGNKTGIPIKARSIYMKPTLAFLEKKFLENENLHKASKKSFRCLSLEPFYFAILLKR